MVKEYNGSAINLFVELPYLKRAAIFEFYYGLILL